ncbi:thiamine biosynthesis protein ThiJ [Saccharomonospora piscinae]|uniref:Thiamine biosynthesis protein ThiJ n=1 Tax=Saccharomonospora piscinae TaxID=687388 RepID=A0A1V9AA67_SACPI|nr:DJ-1/PfpI family protein [Saccharomonospora piscinae]OQO93958.1 thiamine biosynthesis protein ThiJ [Saccharomonospora piscinae]
MKTIAFVLYPGLTPLDLVGPLQVLSNLGFLRPEFETVVVAEHPGVVQSDSTLRIEPDRTFDEVPEPFGIVVPGGLVPTLRALTDETLLGWLRRVSSGADVVGSVCTGALILGAAGLLDGRRATTHWAFLDLLEVFGAVPVSQRWVADGPVFTAAGVSAGIDAALHLAATLAGEDVARQIQFGIEYDPHPPLGPLNWDDAPRQEWAAARARAVAAATDGDSELARRLGV